MNDDVLQQYVLLGKNSEFFLMQDRKTGVKALYKEFFGSNLSESELGLITDNLTRRSLLSSSNLLQIYHYYVTRLPSAPDFRFGLVYEHWLQSFSKELHLKQGSQGYWSEEELLNTMEAVLSGLYALHSQEITHGNITSDSIVVSGEGFVKLADQFVTSPCFKKSFEQIIQEESGFFPPDAESCKWVESKEADLWAVGMVFLEAGSLKICKEAMDWKTGRIRWDVMKDRLQEVEKIYGGGSFHQTLMQLLNPQKEKRRRAFEMFGLDTEETGMLEQKQMTPIKNEENIPKYDNADQIYDVSNKNNNMADIRCSNEIDQSYNGNSSKVNKKSSHDLSNNKSERNCNKNATKSTKIDGSNDTNDKTIGSNQSMTRSNNKDQSNNPSIPICNNDLPNNITETIINSSNIPKNNSTRSKCSSNNNSNNKISPNNENDVKYTNFDQSLSRTEKNSNMPRPNNDHSNNSNPCRYNNDPNASTFNDDQLNQNNSGFNDQTSKNLEPNQRVSRTIPPTNGDSYQRDSPRFEFSSWACDPALQSIFAKHQTAKSEFTGYLRAEIKKREASLERLNKLLLEAENISKPELETTKTRATSVQITPSSTNSNNNSVINVSKSSNNKPFSIDFKPMKIEQEKPFHPIEPNFQKIEDLPKKPPKLHSNSKRSSLSLVKDKYSALLPQKQQDSPDKFGDFSLIRTEDDLELRSFDSKPLELTQKALQLQSLNQKLEDCLSKSRSVSPANSIDFASNRSNNNICAKTPEKTENSFKKEMDYINENSENSFVGRENFLEKSNNSIKRESFLDISNQKVDQTERIKEKPRIKKITFENGDYYEGEVGSDSKRTGYGTLYSKDHRVVYQGEWKEDLFWGHGLRNNLSIVGDYRSGFPFQDFNKVRGYWIRYEGGFKEGKRCGSGVLVLGNKEVFQGMFLDDKVHGKGTFQGTKGRVIGEWKENKLVHKIN